VNKDVNTKHIKTSNLQSIPQKKEKQKRRTKVKEYHIRTKKVAGKTTNKVNSLMQL